jgi:hypothetical protein
MLDGRKLVEFATSEISRIVLVGTLLTLVVGIIVGMVFF